MKILGILLGTLFTLLLLFGPLAGLYVVSKDTFVALGYEGSEVATISDCTSIRLSGPRSNYSRVPVVVLASGQKVLGSVDEIRFIAECDDQIGTSVEVVYDLNDPDNAKLNTFLEFWFLPIVFGLICVAWYPTIVMGYLKKYRMTEKN